MRLIFSLLIVATLAALASGQHFVAAYSAEDGYGASRLAGMQASYYGYTCCHPSRQRVIHQRPEITRMPTPKLTTWQIAEKQLARLTLRNEMHAKAEQARRELGR